MIASCRTAYQVVSVSTAVKCRLGASQKALSGKTTSKVFLVRAQDWRSAGSIASPGNRAVQARVAVWVIVGDAFAVNLGAGPDLIGRYVLLVVLGFQQGCLDAESKNAELDVLHFV
jgi:hypothetical protein